jgi:ariadne-1
MDNGKDCINGKCPYPKCNVLVPYSKMKEYLSEAQFSEFEKFLYKSYTDDNKSIKWCPQARCSYYCENPSLVPTEIKCQCSYMYCFGCNEEAHNPAPCQLNKKWALKNGAEAENVTWIQANAKACPKCHKNIEKNQGCDHMTCTQCRYSFLMI